MPLSDLFGFAAWAAVWLLLGAAWTRLHPLPPLRHDTDECQTFEGRRR